MRMREGEEMTPITLDLHIRPDRLCYAAEKYLQHAPQACRIQ